KAHPPRHIAGSGRHPADGMTVQARHRQIGRRRERKRKGSAMRGILTTVVWTVTILAVFALYAIKHDTRQLEAQVRDMEREAARKEEVLASLRAEWSALTRPARIERLARKHLGYDALAPDQFATVEEIAALVGSNGPGSRR
ncbi:MAG: cell division protein FtsL, partial [Pseudomonadota bacterium]